MRAPDAAAHEPAPMKSTSMSSPVAIASPLRLPAAGPQAAVALAAVRVACGIAPHAAAPAGSARG